MKMTLLSPLTRRKAVRRKMRKGVPKPPRMLRHKSLHGLWSWLCWVTNNEMNPKHEVEFDVAFFIVNTVVLVVGSYYFLQDPAAAPFLALLIIEYTWALDTLRNNRSYIK